MYDQIYSKKSMRCLGVPGGRLDIRSLWGLYKMRETLWFCLVNDLNISVGVLVLCLCVFVCRMTPLQNDTPVICIS